MWTPLPAEPAQPAPKSTVVATLPGPDTISQEESVLQEEAALHPESLLVKPTPLPDTAASPIGPVSIPHAGAGEPAGCLSVSNQSALQDVRAMLNYADSLLGFSRTLTDRLLPDSYNAYTGVFTFDPYGVGSLNVDDVENQFLIQRMLDALQVAGFVSWLRQTPDQGLHILIIPLRDPAVLQSSWKPYIEAYWLDRTALPAGDPKILPTLKLPPCGWMVEQGFAPALDASWWALDGTDWPDYPRAAVPYLAATNTDAARVARQIDWLGEIFPEGPDTMCGPLAWSILHDAGAFPPGFGAWAVSAKAFWLAKPEENGRPWSLFPKDTYTVKSIRSPLGMYDFRDFPLYPGDFLYTYSARDGFDHMFIITETDGAGNVYTVSNIVKVNPERSTTIERVLLLNINDPFIGIARNEWARDKVNGRTGHAGFEIFRWSWMEKDISGQPARYTVMPGDTYGLIAARWKTPADQIAEYNGDTMDSDLSIGQVVLIPPNMRDGR